MTRGDEEGAAGRGRRARAASLCAARRRRSAAAALALLLLLLAALEEAPGEEAAEHGCGAGTCPEQALADHAAILPGGLQRSERRGEEKGA